MFEIEKLKNDIKVWLSEDGLKASEVTVKFTDFQLMLSNAFGLGLEIDIAKLKARPIIVFGTRLRNPPPIQQGFVSLADAEKIKILEELKRDLIKLGVEYNISDKFSEVTIGKEIYM